MSETSNTESSESKQDGSNNSNDLVVGLATFIVFVLFMTGWMYLTA